MIRVFKPSPAPTDPTATAPAAENDVNRQVAMATQNIERVLAQLSETLAELDALQLPRPGPDGKVNTAAQQAFDERLRELQGKLGDARRAESTRQVQVPVLSHGLAAGNEPAPRAPSSDEALVVRSSGT